MLLALSFRLWYLQVLSAPEAAQKVATQSLRTVYDEAPRGRILDRNGEVLVDNKSVLTITYDTKEETNRALVVTRLAWLLNIPQAEIRKKISAAGASPLAPVTIATDVTEEAVIFIRERQVEFPGVSAGYELIREYPHGSLAAHILGYVGEINESELESRKDRGYHPGDAIGKEGIERYYERQLRGTSGKTVYEINADREITRVVSRTDPVAGNDVQLTIDVGAQLVAEESLAQGILLARATFDGDKVRPRLFKAPGGAAVVLDPSDGSVIALASFPTFAPSMFSGGISQDAFDALQSDQSAPLYNRAVLGLYAPGSTFKLVSAVAGLADGVIRPETQIADPKGYIEIADQKYYNAGKKAMGTMSLVPALTQSSDVFFYSIGRDIWEGVGGDTHAVQNVAKSFGFGETTGIELPEPAPPGLVPDDKTRKAQYEANPGAFLTDKWFTGDNTNLAVGQSDLLVSPLQLANAYATFANGGSLFRPHLGGQILKGVEVVDSVKPQVVSRLNFDPALRDPIVEGLSGVISSRAGTAHGAFGGFPTDKVSIAGKTGTAQREGKQDTAVFACFLPVEQPRYAISVIVEEAGFGGQTAAPIARRIIDYLVGLPMQPVHLQTPTTSA